MDFDEIIDRRGTASIKWDRYRGRDVLPLWVADMDFRSPPAVVEALRNRVDHGIFGYTAPPDELVATVRGMLLEEHGWTIEPEWLVWLPGLVTGLNVACRAVGGAGDGVITATPVYPPFLTAPGYSGRELVSVQLAESAGRWTFDFPLMERSVRANTRLFILCNPHNPVGRVFSRQELSELAAFCERHDLVICSDEIHAGLVLDQEKRHTPIATLDPAVARRTITLLAPSKTYNLAGLGCSFAVISDAALRRRFRGAMAGVVPHVNLLGYTAALAAYRDGGEWLCQLLTLLRRNRDLVAAAVARMPGLTMAPVEATYLAWIDTRSRGIAEPARFFEEAGVGLSDGAEFGAPGYLRLNFGCPLSLLNQALDRMAVALDK